MSNQARFMSAIILTAVLGGALITSVALKAPSMKWAKIEQQMLNDITQKIIAKIEISPDEEKIARDNKYVLIKSQAFIRLNNKRSGEALGLLTWIRERYNEDPQIDYFLAQAWQLQDNPDNASKYYQRVVEKSMALNEIVTALDYLAKKDNQSYIEVVRKFIAEQNTDSRFSKLIVTSKESAARITGDDKAFILMIALYIVEGDQQGLMAIAAKGAARHLDSEILKPYQTIKDGKVSLNLQQLGDDLVGKDNPQRKESKKITVDSLSELATELTKK